MTCTDIRIVPQWLPRLAFRFELLPDRMMSRILDGDKIAFEAAFAPWSDIYDFPSAKPLRKLCTASGVWCVLWITRPDHEKPVYISPVPDIYYRHII